MIKRQCPACGIYNYSADTLTVWSCHTCECNIPVEANEEEELM